MKNLWKFWSFFSIPGPFWYLPKLWCPLMCNHLSWQSRGRLPRAFNRIVPLWFCCLLANTAAVRPSYVSLSFNNTLRISLIVLNLNLSFVQGSREQKRIREKYGRCFCFWVAELRSATPWNWNTNVTDWLSHNDKSTAINKEKLDMVLLWIISQFRLIKVFWESLTNWLIESQFS